VPSIYSVRLVNVELSAGLIDDGRHDHPHPHRPPPRAENPPRPRAREPRVAAPTGRPPARRAAATPATRRPTILGPLVPNVERLGGRPLLGQTRDCHPVASDRLHLVLDLEEPTNRSRPSGPLP
jgi:hypothetical protein